MRTNEQLRRRGQIERSSFQERHHSKFSFSAVLRTNVMFRHFFRSSSPLPVRELSLQFLVCVFFILLFCLYFFHYISLRRFRHDRRKVKSWQSSKPIVLAGQTQKQRTRELKVSGRVMLVTAPETHMELIISETSRFHPHTRNAHHNFKS